MMCMIPTGSPSKVEPEPVQALSGQGITNQNPLLKVNKPSKTRRVKKSLRINKPSK